MAVQCLTDFEKDDIYTAWIEGDSKAKLARIYGVSPDTIRRVIKELQDNEGMFEFSIDLGDETTDADEQESTAEYSFIMTPDSISITMIDGDTFDTVNVDDDHEKFEEVYDIIINDPRNQDALAEAYELLNIKQHLANITDGKVTVYPEEDKITYTNDDGSVGAFSGRLVERIISGAKSGDGIEHLIKFANKLSENPSYRAVNELYDFLEAADIKINPDGMVECFKRVRGDFMDVYSGTFDNSVGKTVQVPRNMVDEDSNNTCSYGLHVCSYSYLNSYTGNKVIKVLVDPADFVAIPADYYSYNGDGQVKAKARVCKYQVVEDITHEIFGY